MHKSTITVEVSVLVYQNSVRSAQSPTLNRLLASTAVHLESDSSLEPASAGSKPASGHLA